LERQDNRLCVDYGPEELCCRRRIIRFHTKEHKASWREGARVCTGLDRHSKIAIDTSHAQTPFLQCLQVGAASHERNIRTTLGQESTEIASQATAPHHDNTHRLCSFLVLHQSSASHWHVKRFNHWIKDAHTILALANCQCSGIYTPWRELRCLGITPLPGGGHLMQ
jgi:predicted transposase YbfD/YdcC